MSDVPRAPRNRAWSAERLRDAGWIRAALLDLSLAALAAYAATTLTAEITPAAAGWRGIAAEAVAFVHGFCIAARRAAPG